MKKAVEFAAAIALLTALMTGSASAYLDGGSVSIALQVAVGAVASALVIVKVYFARLAAFFRRLFAPSHAAPSDADQH